MWSEEEMREIPDAPGEEEPAPPRGSGERYAPALRHEVIQRNRVRALTHPHELTQSESVVYTPTGATHGNFIEASYRRILARPEWLARLRKPHTARRRARLLGEREEPWCELDAATSSDALLMNIFCYPGVLASPACRALLGVERDAEPIFGFKPRLPLHRALKDTTEIDLKLGSLLIEAKLTESSHASTPLAKLERYRDLDVVFDHTLFEAPDGSVPAYQLVRGALAAHALESSFCLLTDARRADLKEPWYGVMRAVRTAELRSRLRLLTWQELAGVLPGRLKTFLEEKYGIYAI